MKTPNEIFKNIYVDWSNGRARLKSVWYCLFQELNKEAEGLRPRLEEVNDLSRTVLAFLTASSEPAAEALKAKLGSLTDTYVA
jgi:hypothetical protein